MLITYFIVGFFLFNLQVAILRFHNKKCGMENRDIADELSGIFLLAVGWPITIPILILIAIGFGIQWIIMEMLDQLTSVSKKPNTTTAKE